MVNGLTRLHALGLLHCDLKPANMVLSSALGLLIIDPETICSKDSQVYYPILTTYWYASPELLEESLSSYYIKNSINTKLDIWSLGCILYSFYFRKRKLPWFIGFHGKSDIELQRDVLETINSEYAINWFPEHDDKESFDHLIWEMLQKDPKKRPEMAKIQKRLQNCLPCE